MSWQTVASATQPRINAVGGSGGRGPQAEGRRQERRRSPPAGRMTRLRFGICPTEGGHFFREALAEVERAEALGFDSVRLAEHHGVPDHYWPAPVQMLTALAARTARLLLGANVCVFPFYHPVRLAEETALLDVVSNGRAVLGVVIGYKPDEFLLDHAALERRRRASRRAAP